MSAHHELRRARRSPIAQAWWLARRVGLVSAMTLVSVNIWTGSPLLAIWVGSRVQRNSTSLSMTAVLIVVLVLVGLVASGMWLLRVLDARYAQLIGRPDGPRQPLPWLKSLSGERIDRHAPRAPLSTIELVMVATVVLATVAFEVWFFFLAGSSLPQQ